MEATEDSPRLSKNMRKQKKHEERKDITDKLFENYFNHFADNELICKFKDLKEEWDVFEFTSKDVKEFDKDNVSQLDKMISIAKQLNAKLNGDDIFAIFLKRTYFGTFISYILKWDLPSKLENAFTEMYVNYIGLMGSHFKQIDICTISKILNLDNKKGIFSKQILMDSDPYFSSQAWRYNLKVGDKIDAVVHFKDKNDQLIASSWGIGTIKFIIGSYLLISFDKLPENYDRILNKLSPHIAQLGRFSWSIEWKYHMKEADQISCFKNSLNSFPSTCEEIQTRLSPSLKLCHGIRVGYRAYGKGGNYSDKKLGLYFGYPPTNDKWFYLYNPEISKFLYHTCNHNYGFYEIDNYMNKVYDEGLEENPFENVSPTLSGKPEFKLAMYNEFIRRGGCDSLISMIRNIPEGRREIEDAVSLFKMLEDILKVIQIDYGGMIYTSLIEIFDNYINKYGFGGTSWSTQDRFVELYKVINNGAGLIKDYAINTKDFKVLNACLKGIESENINMKTRGISKLGQLIRDSDTSTGEINKTYLRQKLKESGIISKVRLFQPKCSKLKSKKKEIIIFIVHT